MQIRKILGAILVTGSIVALAITLPVFAYGARLLSELFMLVFIELALLYFGIWIYRGKHGK